MPSTYDFQNLSYDDFEQLCADLLESELGIPLESFKIGRDGGIDLRYAPAPDNALIVQCKNYAPNAFSRLLRDLKKKEIAKVERLKPARYILCTSCLLSPHQKDQLLAVLSPYCKSTGDIFGANELNRLIAGNGGIERKHFKLWLGSTEILQRILHSGIFMKSNDEVELLRREVSRYVVHDGFYRALSLLDEAHHCIIVGIPGVGKTIAARLLLAHYLRDGYEVISVSQDIEEAWRVLDRVESSKVVIYYDDFLGQMTYEQKLAKNEDKRLLQLVEHCRRSDNKRFILTTRDYIFDQALAAYEPLGYAENDLRRSSVRLDDYGLIVRAKLFANHLQFSDIGFNLLRELVLSKGYDPIIRHPNFLPRVIQQICSSKELERLEPKEFSEWALSLLNDPSQVWSRPFQQLSADARLLLYTLASLNGEAESGEVEKAWRALCTQLAQSVGRYYREVLREVEGSFTQSQVVPSLTGMGPKDGRIIRFVNPSAREYVLKDLVSRVDIFRGVVSCALFFKQLNFWSGVSSSFIDKKPCEIAQQFADLIASQSIRLLSTTESSLVPWGGQTRIKWTSSLMLIGRLRTVFRHLQWMEREELADEVVRSLFGDNLSAFGEMVGYGDLAWLPEVVRQVTTSLEFYEIDLEHACERFSIEGWADLPGNFEEVGYVWEAAKHVLFVAGDTRQESRMRERLEDKCRELCSAIPHDWSGDELEHELIVFEDVARKIGGSLNREILELSERLSIVRGEEDDKAEQYAQEYQQPVRQVANQGKISDVDDIFASLLSQMAED